MKDEESFKTSGLLSRKVTSSTYRILHLVFT